MTTCAITAEIVEGYSLCPRKAFFFLWDRVEKDPHEYASLIEEQEAENCKTHRVARSQVIALGYAGHVLGQLQHHVPIAGTIVRADGRACRLNLTKKYQQVKSIVTVLKAWTEDPSEEAPPVILNKDCPSCPFRDPCCRQAETEDNLSLLERMSPRIMKKYHAKGIFTVNQL